MVQITYFSLAIKSALFAATWCLAAVLLAQTPEAPSSAEDLLATHASLKPRLSNNPFRRPLVLESTESAQRIDGSVYAVLDSPFSELSRTLKSPAQWCEVMILHQNTKYCRAARDTSPSELKVSIGRKTPQKLSEASSLAFGFNALAVRSDYLEVLLSAAKGPLGTSNYKIGLQAVPLPDNRTFMRLNYSYGYGMASRVAMQGYLATVGSGKVGFTPVSNDSSSGYIGGMRGAAERNIMRYYLAIEAHQATLSALPASQLEARLGRWFSATEEFPRQLRELTKADYMTMKKSEYQRQQSDAPVN